MSASPLTLCLPGDLAPPSACRPALPVADAPGPVDPTAALADDSPEGNLLAQPQP